MISGPSPMTAALANRLSTAARTFVLARHAPAPVLDRWETFDRSIPL